ncbi:ribosome maturation factor RimM [Sunxiuqinia sp. sy24]|uniref:ribosome maturation factor RimM n=1 Tax=Sunxiuqinia sp. sy24 TaxID=3461495 RepID=UPI004045ED99
METIEKNTCQKIGYFQKPHGIRGALSLIFEPQYDLSLEEEPTLFLELDGLLVPYFLADEGLRFRSAESAIVQLDWVENEEQARKLSGVSVFLKEEDLIHSEEEFSLHRLISFKLSDPQIGEIGTIERVEDFGGNLLFQVQYQGKEVLIPFNEELLVKLDENERTIVIQCPDGILDLD